MSGRFLTVRSRMCKVGSHIVDIHLLLINADALFLSICIGIFFRSTFSNLTVVFTDLLDNSIFHLLSLILTLFFLFFAFFPFLLFRFFLRTGRLVQSSQVNLADHINLGYKFRLTNLENILLLLLGCNRLRSFHFRLCLFFFCHFRHHLHLRFFLFHFFHYFFFYYRRLRLFYHYRLHLFFHRFRLYDRCYDFFFLHLGDNRFRCLLFFLLFSYHRSGLLSLRLRLLFRFAYRFFFYFPVEFIQINFSDRFKLRTCIFGNDCLDNIIRLRLLRLLFVTIDRHRRLITILVLTFLDKTF